MFTCPVSMKIPSQEYYERDLEQQLLKLGYKLRDNRSWSIGCPYLITRWSIDDREGKQMGFNQAHSYHRDCYKIHSYNPELFLALAGLTNDPAIKEGDWVRSIDESVDYRRGMIYRVDKFDSDRDVMKSSTSSPLPFAEKSIDYFRKATKEEIIQHFNKPRPSPSFTFTTDSDTSSSSMETKTIMKTRILKREDFVKYYPSLCIDWKIKLKAAFSDFAVTDTVVVLDKLYKEMREQADKRWNTVLDELFGKEKQDNLAIPNISDKTFEFEEFSKEIGLHESAIQPAAWGLEDNDERRYRSLYFDRRYDWKFDSENNILTAYLKK